MDLPARMHASIVQHHLLKRGAAVLVGVSGGVDSMVLLRLLHQPGAWNLTVAHFNHSLRGAESDADEAFVAAAAAALKLPFVSARGDVKAFADEHGISIEMAARELRHGFVIDTAARFGIEKIALAHHADDQVETFWLRLLRGDVGPGLAGIRWQRPARSGTNISFIRPLLEIAKADLLVFARAENIAYREDASNLSSEFLRNRLRLELLARLKNFQPALRDVTLRTTAILSAEKQFLEETARHWLHSRSPAFADLHIALQREVVRLQLLDLNQKPNYELIESLRTNPAPISISPEKTVSRTPSGDLSVSRACAIPFSANETIIDLRAPGRICFQDLELEWTFVSSRGTSALGQEFFDADRIGPTATLRHWQRGDRFQPIGSPGETKLQDLFTNLKVSPTEKRRRFLAADGRGKLFWVEGLRISEAHKVTPKTQRILSWSWRKRP